MIKLDTPVEYHVSFLIAQGLSRGVNVTARSPDEAVQEALFLKAFDHRNLLYVAPKEVKYEDYTVLADFSDNPEN